jgi:hypothetical protein
MVNEEEWQAIRLRAAERCFLNDQEQLMWMNLFYWAEPLLEFQVDEMDMIEEAETNYVPPPD